jgi:DNA-binding HxlR family transcriptional regulator
MQGTTSFNIFSAICVTRRAITRIADKWTILVIAALADEPHHFGELRRKIECISQKMLTQTLRKLEADGFVKRTVGTGNVVKVAYSLTPLGASLVQPLEGLQQWAIEHADELQLS